MESNFGVPLSTPMQRHLNASSRKCYVRLQTHPGMCLTRSSGMIHKSRQSRRSKQYRSRLGVHTNDPVTNLMDPSINDKRLLRYAPNDLLPGKFWVLLDLSRPRKVWKTYSFHEDGYWALSDMLYNLSLNLLNVKLQIANKEGYFKKITEMDV